jgi:beta-galactosidase
MMRLGVCYYPEQWPEALWTQDAAEMREIGLSLVRIGEFAWSRIEPERNRFEWDWLDRAIETLADAGLQIVLGTPTATPPRWLILEHPEILAVGTDGRPRGFGSRKHYCFSSGLYRKEARRITEALARRYGAHPAITMWQTDNEYGCHDTIISYSPAAAKAFRLWLEAKYGNVTALNAAWGNVFWSMEYPDFAAIDPPIATVTEPNPAHVLDWRRFSSDQVARFNRAQTEVLRVHAPSAKLLHNYMGFFTAFDHRAVAADLDAVGWDSYPLGFLDKFDFPEEEKRQWCRTGHPDIAAFHHDLYRGIGAASFGVMEQQAGPVNWAPHNPAPLPGMVRFWTLEAMAHGADFVAYFRWRQCPFAQEQMHSGLKLPDNTPDFGFEEVRQAAAEIAKLPETPHAAAPGARPPGAGTPVALVFDYESQWLIETEPQGENFSHRRLAFEFYSALRQLGLNVDIVSADADLSGYKLVVVPCLPIIGAERAARFAALPGQVLFGPRSGSKTENFSIPPNLAPGPLGQAMGFSIPRVESLRDNVEIGVGGEGITGALTIWREQVRLESAPSGAELIAHASDGAPALLRRGTLHYLAGWPDKALLDSVLGRLAREAGLDVIPLANGLRLRCQGGLHFAFNFGPDIAESPAPGGSKFVLGARSLPPGAVAAWRPSSSP